MTKRLLVLICALLVGVFFAERALQKRAVGSRTKKVNPDSPQGLLLARQQAKLERYAKGIPKPEAPDEFLKYHAEIRTRDGETVPEYPLNYKMIETKKAIALKAASLNKRSALSWIERGPGNVGGRTRGLIVDPDDPTKNTWFAGGVSGGIWKSTNAGGTWVNKTPSLPNLAITWLVMAASNHNVIYAATGEGFGNIDAVKGDGMWKSTDRGETWIQIASTASNVNFAYVNRIIVSPSDENTLLAATNAGIFRSSDGGSSWVQVYSSTGRIQDLVANPQDFTVQYATRNSFGVLKSTDAGISWSTVTSDLGSGARYELTISPVDPNRLFVAIETNSSTSDLYVSDDGAASWTKAAQSGTSPNWLNGQGWYDNAIAAHPYNKDVVFVGGLDIYKIQVSPSATLPGITSVAQNNTSSFLGFVNWGGPYAGGGVGSGADFYGTATNPIGVTQSDYASVEVRFGPGLSQKAHRFTFGTSFIYPYLDYVTVPFQVWDVTNNRQLMVSFRDSDGNGEFNLITFNSANPQREYVFIHAVPYNVAAADPTIAQSGGERYKNIYAFWPILPTNGTWNPNSLPSSNLRINYGLLRSRTTTKLTNWFPNLANPAGGFYPYVHADHHNLTIIPADAALQTFRILNGSDGGVAISIDGGTTWSNTNTGYNTSQFYGADKRPGADQYIGGTQDNGTWLSPINTTASSGWTAQIGGDGFMVSWHYTDQNKIIGSVQYNSFRRTTNGGVTWTPATTDMTGVGSGTTSPFISALAKSNSDPDLLFAVGSLGVWRSDNFAENWTLTNIATNWGFGTGVRAAISLAQPQIVWAGVRMSNSGTLGKIHVSTDGGITFSPTTNYTLATLGRLSGFATHPTQSNTAYALFSIAKAPKILRTTDLGQTWTDISGFGSGTVSTNGFPDVATYCLLVMPHNPNEIWVGTEIGLFVSTNGGTSWSYANDGLPAVSVWQLSITDDQVIAATHGRGVWSVIIPELRNYTPPVVTLPPRLNKSFQGPDGNLGIRISLRSSYDSTIVTVGTSRFAVLAGNTTAKDTIIQYPISAQTILTTSVTSYKNNIAYKSAQRGFPVSMIQSPRSSFSDNFDAASSNYISSGFVLSRPTGFTSQAYHTPHPYSNNRDYTLTLNIPIIVQQSNAFVRFDEVVLVEPGETGSKFGDPDFWDYVVVEGSKDGGTWTPIEDGYDSRYDPAWLSAYNSGSSGTASLIRKHQMNVLNKFAAGDLIFIRFRLYADPNTTGWGWMFDNLEIQESVVSVENQNVIPSVFALDQNYPNPFNPSTTIRFALPTEAKVTLKLYDIRGRLIQTLLDKQLSAGFHSEVWHANGHSTGVYFYRIEATSLSTEGKKFIETRKLVLVK